jgi:hypothetical protein
MSPACIAGANFSSHSDKTFFAGKTGKASFTSKIILLGWVEGFSVQGSLPEKSQVGTSGLAAYREGAILLP